MLALFLASGFVALLYQVIWQRLLGLVTGLDLYAVTLIVSVFMLGMGIGSVAGGVLADRVPASRLLTLFAGAEALIALFALASKPLYYDLLRAMAATPERSPALVAAAAAVTLLVPTGCMGVTLPLLSKVLSESLDVAAGRIAALYGWNTLGAALGAWAGSAVLVGAIGYERSLGVGVVVNVACAATALLLQRSTGVSRRFETRHGAASNERPIAIGGWSWWRWLALYFLSGFVALGLEMVWFRLLAVLLKSTAYTFPLLLGFYLVGVAGGSLAGGWLASRARHPLRWFLLAQGGIPLYSGLSVVLLLWALRTQNVLEPLRAYLASYEPLPFSFNFFGLSAPQLALYVLGPGLLILPPTILMGASFSLLQRGVHSDLAALGRRVGGLQAANILGATAGVLLVGLVLIERLGTAGTLQWLTACGAVYLALACLEAPAGLGNPLRWTGIAVGLAVTLWTARSVPAASAFWGRLHSVPPTRIIFSEDGSGLAVLTSPDASFRQATVYVNGLGQSSIPFSFVHSFLGLVPVLLHPAPVNVAIIGLGSGGTAYSAAGRPETEHVYCVEIIVGQLRTLRELHQRTGDRGLGGLLADPRMTFVIGDGRQFVAASPTRFDVIEADALRPTSAYAGTLYSIEYFQLLRSRLNRGGFAVTWAPTTRIERTFDRVFPHVLAVPPIRIGSNEPIAVEADAVRRRASHPATVEHYRRAGIDVDAHLALMLQAMRPSSVRLSTRPIRPSIPISSLVTNWGALSCAGIGEYRRQELRGGLQEKALTELTGALALAMVPTDHEGVDEPRALSTA